MQNSAVLSFQNNNIWSRYKRLASVRIAVIVQLIWVSSAVYPAPYPEDHFSSMAGRRDASLGAVVMENNIGIVRSQSVDVVNHLCKISQGTKADANVQWFGKDPHYPAVSFVAGSEQKTLVTDYMKFFQQSALDPILTLCPSVEEIELSVGFYDTLVIGSKPTGESSYEPLTVARLNFNKAQVGWVLVSTTLMPNTSTLTRAEVLNMGGRKYAWLARPEYGYAMGRFFVPTRAPGIVYKENTFWDQFEHWRPSGADDDIKLALGVAHAVFDGQFDIFKNASAELRDRTRVTFDQLLYMYEVSCPTELKSQPALEITSSTIKTDQSGWESVDSRSVRVIPERFSEALKKSDTWQNRNMASVFSSAANGSAVNLILETRSAAKKFLETQGCRSQSTEQLMENFRRLFMGLSSLQADALNSTRGNQ